MEIEKRLKSFRYAYLNCLNSLLLVEGEIKIRARTKMRASKIGARKPLLSV